MLALMAYVDVGLQSQRLMILFGAALGLISVLNRLWPSQIAAVPEKPAGLVNHRRLARR